MESSPDQVQGSMHEIQQEEHVVQPGFASRVNLPPLEESIEDRHELDINPTSMAKLELELIAVQKRIFQLTLAQRESLVESEEVKKMEELSLIIKIAKREEAILLDALEYGSKLLQNAFRRVQRENPDENAVSVKPVQPGSKVVPQNLPKFRGTGGIVEPLEFLEEFSKIMEAYNINSLRTIKLLPLCLDSTDTQ